MNDFKDQCIEVMEREGVSWEQAEEIVTDRYANWCDFLHDRQRDLEYEKWSDNLEDNHEQE